MSSSQARTDVVYMYLEKLLCYIQQTLEGHCTGFYILRMQQLNSYRDILCWKIGFMYVTRNKSETGHFILYRGDQDVRTVTDETTRRVLSKLPSRHRCRNVNTLVISLTTSHFIERSTEASVFRLLYDRVEFLD